ncbi:hypothetical protein AZI86_17075 [Bdellovibrio bacteriovorus]|uniref:Outer membrane protein beta-barrel domain-containing protein n=1 Tax=Bdellovibrio bacteriovorus TaxID=959 RepID=A0A150WEI2_BDEBC|nr:hypothetical protein [Bdellovibrio bacteriovorus]KYG61426.1 hypothetical protein AZI86_17075 [Bdellovibrio bacteriovorus]
MKSLTLSVLLLFSLTAKAGEKTYSSKLILRSGMGQLTNTGTQSGSAVSVGSLNLQYLKFLNERLGLVFGYMAEFDVTNGSMPVSGMEIGSRYYFYNTGTTTTEKSDWGVSRQRSLWNAYFALVYGKRDFYLGPDYQSNDATSTLKGEYAVMNLGAGIDYYLNYRYDLNIELSTSALSFASSDARVNLSETFLRIGIGYVF